MEDDNVFNSANKLISVEEVKAILKRYGLPPVVHNLELYRRAFVHRSYCVREGKELSCPEGYLPLRHKSNERLEFLGDGVLECVSKFYLYRRFAKENEGFMTEKKIAIVKNEAIGRIALEMGLHKWLILSKHAEEKKIRTNLKKLGCLFESFLGALFLDFNKIVLKDEDGWFQNMFVTGPGFQMVQKFIENVFEQHINWIELIQNDDNYKNILQVKIQKEFKVTPHYLEMEHDVDQGYRMGVFLCLGQQVHNLVPSDAIHIETLKTFQEIQTYITTHGKVFLFLGQGLHKIKRKAEQEACLVALGVIEKYSKPA